MTADSDFKWPQNIAKLNKKKRVNRVIDLVKNEHISLLLVYFAYKMHTI